MPKPLTDTSRKVIGGKRSLLVPIPQVYASRMTLQKGSTLTFSVWGDRLIFTPFKGGKDASEHITLDLRSLPPDVFNASTLRRVLDQIYTYGTKKVTIRFQDVKIRDYYRLSENAVLVSELISKLISTYQDFGVIEQSKGVMVIGQTQPLNEAGFQESFNKFYYQLVTNFKLIIDRVHTRDVALLQKAYDFDKDLINHHYRYCLRVLNQIGCVDFQRTLIVHSCLSLYELLGDKLGDITKVLKRTSREASSKSLGLMLEILDLFINYMKPFKEYTISEVNAYLNAKFKIQNELVLLENDPESELKTEMYNLIVFMTHIAETHISKEWLR